MMAAAVLLLLAVVVVLVVVAMMSSPSSLLLLSSQLMMTANARWRTLLAGWLGLHLRVALCCRLSRGTHTVCSELPVVKRQHQQQQQSYKIERRGHSNSN